MIVQRLLSPIKRDSQKSIDESTHSSDGSTGRLRKRLSQLAMEKAEMEKEYMNQINELALDRRGQSKEIEQKIEEIESLNNLLLAENKYLKEQHSAQIKANVDDASSNDKNNSLESSLQRMKEKYSKETKSNEFLKGQIEIAKSNQQAAEKSLAELMESSEAQLHEKNIEIEKLRRTIKNHNKLDENLQASNGGKAEDLQRELDELRSVMTSMESQLVNLKLENEKITDEKENIKNSLKKEMKCNEDLMDKVMMLQKHDKQIECRDDNPVEARDGNIADDREDLLAQIEAGRVAKMELEKTLIETTNIFMEKEYAKDEKMANLEHRLDLEKISNANKKEELEKISKEMEDLRSKISELQSENTSTSKEHEEKYKWYEEEILKRDEKLLLLKKELDELSVKDKKIIDLTEQLAEMKEMHLKEVNTSSALKKQLDDTTNLSKETKNTIRKEVSDKYDQDIKNLKSQLKSVQEEKARLLLDIKHLQDASMMDTVKNDDERTNNGKILKELQAENDRLQRLVDQQEVEVKRSQEEKQQVYVSMKNQTASKQAEILELNYELMQKQSMIASSERDIMKLKSEIDELKLIHQKEVDKLLRDIHDSRESGIAENLRIRNVELEMQLSSLSKEFKLLNEKCNSLTANSPNEKSMQVLRARNEAQKLEIEKLRTNMRCLRKSISRIEI